MFLAIIHLPAQIDIEVHLANNLSDTKVKEYK